MAQVINTNISSLNAQRNLNSSQSALATSLQRLSSGLRINSAKDDAAGMAISERFTTQIRGTTQAARNANDAISLSQTAESAMNEVTNNLQRIRELAVQSLNATNSASDRKALDAEVQQLKSEIDRVATQTAFNGVKLLDGSFQSQAFQVGANVNETIVVDKVGNLRTSAMGQGYGATQAGTTLTAPTGITGTGQFTFTNEDDVEFDIYQGSNIAGNARDIANAINSRGITGLTATAAATVSTVGTRAAAAATAGTATLTLNGTDISITLGAHASASGDNLTAAYEAINNNSAATGVTAALSGAGLQLTAADGRNITYSFAEGTAAGATVGDIGLGAIAATTYGTYSLKYSGDETLQTLTVGGSVGAGVKGVADGDITPAKTGTQISLISVDSVANANKTLESIDNALTTLNSARGAMGAYQNRFQSVINSLSATSENLTAARSRIQDADFAAETAALTRNQILQQAGVAMLSQANALPQNVLSLLK